MRKDIEAYSEEELKNTFIHSESVMDLAEKINNAKLLFKHQTLLGLSQLHDKKNTDYGNAATISYMEYGPISYVVRLRDKLERFKRISYSEALVDEDMKELLGDIINYCMMFKAANHRVSYSVNVEPVPTYSVSDVPEINYMNMVMGLNLLTNISIDDKVFNSRINNIVQICLELLWEVENDDNK